MLSLKAQFSAHLSIICDKMVKLTGSTLLLLFLLTVGDCLAENLSEETKLRKKSRIQDRKEN